MTAALQDRLLLNDARIEGMAKGLDDIVALPDPVGAEIETLARGPTASRSAACACRSASSA